MEYIIIAIIIVAVITAIAYPLFTGIRDDSAEAPDTLDTLVAQRDSVYAALRDLDFDFQLGKLSAQDHAAMRDKYKARAATVLQQLDAAHADQAQAEIETQVAQRRKTVPADVEAEIARLRAAKVQAAGARCAKCGTPRKPGDQFCAKCGSKLSFDS